LQDLKLTGSAATQRACNGNVQDWHICEVD
jgi:hypothetical protein